MRFLPIFMAALLFSTPAIPQHSHGDIKGPNGGPMQDVAGVHAELIISGNTLTINVFDESNKPINVRGFSATALIVASTDREVVALSQSGESALKGEAKKPIVARATVTITLKTPSGKSGQAKFKPTS